LFAAPRFIICEGAEDRQIIYLFQMLKIILYKEISDKKITMDNDKNSAIQITGTCFIQKIYAPSSSLLQGKHLPFTPSPQYFSLICDSFADPIISLHSQDISLFNYHI
jgi:hypothetical protein